MKENENEIIYKEIKTYEEACYYNSDPDNRKKYKGNEFEVKKKDSKIGKFLEKSSEGIFEGILEFIFSIFD